MNRPEPSKKPIPDDLIVALSEDADCRRIGSGTARIESCTELIDSFDVSADNAASFLMVFARWCDIADGSPGLVKKLLEKYNKTFRARLPVADFVRIRLVEGLVALKEEMVDKALEDFDIVLKLADEATVPGALALANYWSSRCFRIKGNYDRALVHVRTSRQMQLSSGRLQCGASMRILESLILLAKGEPKAAIEQLRTAEEVLSQTDDFITLGNIQSAYGRILQNQDRYREAMEHYARAVEYFQRRESQAGNVARAEVDASFARIQVLRQLRRNIDIHVGQERREGDRQYARTVLIKELSKLYDTILTDLDRATSIYERQPNVRGIARVHLYRGYLHHIVGELDLAMEEASKAYAAAESKRDSILMSSARHLQCMVEEANVEEEIQDWADHALAARDYARDAVELASETEDRRLLARAHTWYGIILANAFFNSRDHAFQQAQAAANCLDSTTPDYIQEEFQILKKRLVEHGALDVKLRQWARGEIRDKTFRQLEEDFADLVIPIAWRQEDQKISRVASRFSISPRKVRRVLARLGYLDRQVTADEKDVESLRVIPNEVQRTDLQLPRLRRARLPSVEPIRVRR